MNAIELFAGVGGFRLGLQSNGINVLWANEWDKYAAQTYDKNFGGAISTTDITAVPTSAIPSHELLVGGFPCQAFSIAGRRAGFNETRGTLFFDVARILKDKTPRHFLLENVKGLLTHNGGATFQTILTVLADLGYRVEWQVLNSKDFGVPQNRERVYIIGHFGAGCSGQVLPIAGSGNTDIYQAGQAQSQGQRLRRSDISTTIDANYHKGAGSTRQMVEEPYMLHNVYGGFKETKPRKFYKISPTIRTPQGGGHLPMLKTGKKIRRLTPIECERLQGFPDNWTDGVSDTQRYKQMGNAVTVNVIDAIAKKLKMHDTNQKA